MCGLDLQKQWRGMPDGVSRAHRGRSASQGPTRCHTPTANANAFKAIAIVIVCVPLSICGPSSAFSEHKTEIEERNLDDCE